MNTQTTVDRSGCYNQWIGKLTGNIRGQDEVFEGQGRYEQYALVQRCFARPFYGPLLSLGC